VSGGLWRYHAPEYYIIMDRNIEEGAPSGGLRSTVLTLQEGTVRAVFTSVELARDFAETFYAEEDPVTPVVTSMDAFKLANSVDLSEEVGVREVVFDGPPSNHALELLPPLYCGVGLWAEEVICGGVHGSGIRARGSPWKSRG
jgi:hypothetical protein